MGSLWADNMSTPIAIAASRMRARALLPLSRSAAPAALGRPARRSPLAARRTWRTGVAGS